MNLIIRFLFCKSRFKIGDFTLLRFFSRINSLNKVVFFNFILFLITSVYYSQLTVPNYTACPNQMVNITANWNNVSNVTYILNTGTPPTTTQASPNFSVSSPSTVNFTISASGTSGGNPVNSSTVFTLFISAPPPMAILNQGNYCYNSTATLTAPLGGITYSLFGPPGTPNIFSNSNIITVPNLNPLPYNGTYTVISVFAGCTNTGVTNISVSPNTAISVSSPTNVCLGGSACLTANLPAQNNGYSWTGPNSFSNPNQNPCIPLNTVNQSGVYTVFSNISFGNILCPRTATTSISVVQTNQVIVAASPAYTLCQGVNLNLSAGASNAIGFSWTGPQAYSSSLQSPILNNIVSNNSGSYSVVALFTNGVITCTTAAALTVSIVATAQPVIYSTTNVCKDGTVNFSVTSSPSALTYSWSGPQSWSSVLTAPTINSIQANQSGIYYAYARFGIGSVFCTTSKSVQVNVVPVNTIAVVPPGSVCQPNNAYLQASAVAAYSFNWVGPNGFVSSLPNSTVYYPTISASGIYTITATFYNGIIYCYNTNTVSLTIYPLLNFTLVPWQQVCYNTPLFVNGPSGASSYTWSSSNGFASNIQNINFQSVQPNNSGTYTLNVSLGPCISTQTTSINVLTPIQFTLSPFNRTICRNDTTLLSGAVTGGSENYAYIWNPSVYLNTPYANTQKCSPLGTTVYNLIANDIACPNYTISTSLTVTVNQPPVPDLRLQKIESCQPLCIFLNTRTKNEAAITTFDFGNNILMQADSFNYCIEKPGSYTLKILSKGINGCSGKYEYPNPLVVYPKPGSDILWDPESPTITDAITIFPTNKYPTSNYTWMFTGLEDLYDDTTNIERPTVMYENTGRYPILLISKTEKECTDTVLKFIDVRDNFNVYIPNTFSPNGDGINDVFQVKSTGVSLQGFILEIYDRWGTVIYSTKDITSGWNGNINDQKAQDGIYIYKIKIIGTNGEGRKEYTGQISLLK